MITPTVEAVIDAARKYYETNPSGGNLHIVLDDGNIDNDHIDFCLMEASKVSDHDGIAICVAMKLLSATQRQKVYDKLHNNPGEHHADFAAALYLNKSPALTDAENQLISELGVGNACYEFDQAAFIRLVRAHCADISRERDELAAWKQSALTVESWWKKIDEFIRKHPDATLGRNVSDIAMAWLKERDELKQDRERLDWLCKFTEFSFRVYDSSAKEFLPRQMAQGVVIRHVIDMGMKKWPTP